MSSLLLLILGLVLLVKGADWLVSGAASLARRLGVSDLTIGLTVVAFGTSMPELMVSVLAVVEGKSAIALGNVLGSNIANILLILGVAALIVPLRVTVRTVRFEIPLCVLAGVAVALLAINGVLGRLDGIVMLVVFVGFMAYIWRTAKLPGSMPEIEVPAETLAPRAAVGWTIAGLAALIGGGKALVTGAVALAAWAGISEAVIGLTVVAIGTSLPELATSLVAAWRGNADIAVGNVVGSNVFNVFFILGTSSVVRPIAVPASSAVDVGMVILSALMLLAAMWSGRRYLLERWEGIVCLAAYAGYIGWLAIGG